VRSNGAFSGDAMRAVGARKSTMPSKKLISLFLLTFVLLVLFYIMWVISREYPFELAFRLGTDVIAIIP
jgi:hypothetical protein